MAAPLAAVKIDPSLNPHERKQVLRQTVIDEIVSTEEDYVADLEALVTQCLRPATQRLREADLRQLFANVEELYNINRTLLAQFQQRAAPNHAKHGVLGDLFQEMGEKLRQYADIA